MVVDEVMDCLSSIETKYSLLEEKITHLNSVERQELGRRIKASIANQSSHLVRNNMALVALDIGDDSFLQALFDSIKSSETKGYRGTVLYTISHFNAIEYIEQLTEYAITDTLESRCHAIDAIENFQGTVDGELLLKCLNRVRKEYEQLLSEESLSIRDSERLKDVKYLLEFYEDGIESDS